MFSKKLKIISHKLANQCIKRNIHLVTAESCTGGLLSAIFTEIPASSNWV